jgi:hypothetical protein
MTRDFIWAENLIGLLDVSDSFQRILTIAIWTAAVHEVGGRAAVTEYTPWLMG